MLSPVMSDIFCTQSSVRRIRVIPILVLIIILTSMVWGVAAASSTTLRIAKIAPDGVTLLNETIVKYTWMEANLPVLGDGTTHYFLQGPVFVDDADPAREEELRWNAAEDTNVQEKDMGAVKGTDLKHLCNLVGGMSSGDVLKIKAADGFAKTFAYKNVYTPTARQGPMVITWYNADEGYVPQYRTGMRLIFFADNSTNPWGIHAFGNNDWQQAAAPGYWYYYQQGDEKYPTTTGLSVQSVSEILIYSRDTVSGESTRVATTAPVASPTPAAAGISPFTLVCSLAACGTLGYVIHRRI